MRAAISQLVPGCVLLKDVVGKTNRPIIPKETVLTDEHITILHKFLVEVADVAPKLANGELFQPDLYQDGQENAPQLSNEQTELDPFAAHYKRTVDSYKKWFNKWQNASSVDIPEVRHDLIPFFETVDTADLSVFMLYRYATAEDYIFHHSVSVGILAAYLAKKLGYEKGEWLQIGLAGTLSDCGLAKIDEAIIKKGRSLSYSQLEAFKKHPVLSYRLLEKVPAVTKTVKLAVLQHHERLDGSGYPLGVTKEKIHMYSRVIAVCDAYYQKIFEQKQSPFDVLGQLKNEQYTTFDHNVLQVFMESFANVSAGAKVRLSTKQSGEIVFMNSQDPEHPIVKLDDSNEILPLGDHNDLHIEDML